MKQQTNNLLAAIVRCDQEIVRCRLAAGDLSLPLEERLGAQRGELDWMLERVLIEEKLLGKDCSLYKMI